MWYGVHIAGTADPQNPKSRRRDACAAIALSANQLNWMHQGIPGPSNIAIFEEKPRHISYMIFLFDIIGQNQTFSISSNRDSIVSRWIKMVHECWKRHLEGPGWLYRRYTQVYLHWEECSIQESHHGDSTRRTRTTTESLYVINVFYHFLGRRQTCTCFFSGNMITIE